MINKDELNNITAYDLLFKIIWYSEEERIEFYKDKNISNKLRMYLFEAEKDPWHYFRKLAQTIDMKEIFIMFSENDLDELFEYNYSYIFFAALLENDLDKALNIFLKHDNLFIKFNEKMDFIYSLIRNLICTDAMAIINKNKKLGLNGNYKFVHFMNIEEQKKLVEKIIDKDVLASILNYVNIEVLKEFYLNDSRALDIYANPNAPNIVTLSRDGVKFNRDIIYDKNFFEKLKTEDITDMRDNINMIQQTNPSNNLRENLFRYYDSIIDSYDIENKIIKISGIKSQDETTAILNEIVSDALFEDNLYNVRLNIMELLRYNSYLEEPIVDSDTIEFYNTILNIEQISNEDKIKIYNNYKDKNINTMFYIHLRTLRDMSYREIKSSVFIPGKNNEYIVPNIKENFGVEVYDLRDKEYKMLVRAIGHKYNEETTRSRDSYTLISNENNSLIIDINRGSFVYGYDNFDISKILHVYESDSFSTDVDNFNNTSLNINRIMTPDEIVENSDTTGYSEVQIANEKVNDKYKTLTPSYIVCYDWITEEAFLESKRLNIPICIITYQYIKKEGIENLSTERYKNY